MFFATTEPATAARIAIDSKGRHRGLHATAISGVALVANGLKNSEWEQRGCPYSRGPIGLKIAPFRSSQIIPTFELSLLQHMRNHHPRNCVADIPQPWQVLYRRRKTNPPSTASAKSPNPNTSTSKATPSLQRTGKTPHSLICSKTLR